MSAADILRRAAALMRERAEAATPGPWAWEPPSGEKRPQGDESLVTAYVPDGDEHPATVLYGWGYDASGIDGKDADRAHIASWHPAVALAVADWLDHAAESADLNRSPYVDDHLSHALNVARRYLGEDGER